MAPARNIIPVALAKEALQGQFGDVVVEAGQPVDGQSQAQLALGQQQREQGHHLNVATRTPTGVLAAHEAPVLATAKTPAVTGP